MTSPITYKFCLYVADGTMNSGQAEANLHALCSKYIQGQYQIELVDVFKEPERALAERIFMTPTLVKLEPGPIERVVGNLSQTRLVLQVLGLGTTPP